MDLRSWDSNIEFVKNSYHLYVIVLVWAFSNRWKSNLRKKTRKFVIYEQHSKVHLTITFSKNFLKQTTKAISAVQLSHSPSKTFVISPTSPFWFPWWFFQKSVPHTLPNFLEISFGGGEKRGGKYKRGIIKDVKRTHTHTHTRMHQGNMRTKRNGI